MARGSSGSGDPAVLGRGLRVRGRVRGDGDLRIEGTVDGDVTVSGALDLAHGATVTGGLSAASVTVSGSLEGDTRAGGAVTVVAGARMRGDVHAAEFTLEEGASFEGRVDAEFDLPESIA